MDRYEPDTAPVDSFTLWVGVLKREPVARRDACVDTHTDRHTDRESARARERERETGRHELIRLQGERR